MKLVDVNVLLYAVNEADPKHPECRQWLDSALGGTEHETVGFAWAVVLAFLRLSTKLTLFPNPLPVGDALTIVRRWLEQPVSVMVHPTSRHLELLSGLLADTGTGGNLTSDAHLAALALEHHATVVTYDADFGRFKGVRWVTPPGTMMPS